MGDRDPNLELFHKVLSTLSGSHKIFVIEFIGKSVVSQTYRKMTIITTTNILIKHFGLLKMRMEKHPVHIMGTDLVLLDNLESTYSLQKTRRMEKHPVHIMGTNLVLLGEHSL